MAGLTPVAEPFAVTYVITGVSPDDPTIEQVYTLTLGPGPVTLLPGGSAPVGLRMTIETARGIATGALNAQRAFLDGNMRIDGDAQALLGRSDALAAVDEQLASVRADTQL